MVRALSRRLLLLGAVTASCLVWVGPAQAADFRSGAARQEITGLIQDDVYVAGETVTIPGVVSGDVVGFGRRFVVGGTVGGSVLAGAETVEISGGVGQSARVGARIVEVSGMVGGDLLAGGQSVLLSEKGVVNRDVLLGARDAEIEGQVSRHVKGGAQSLMISGTVKGDVQVETDELTLGPAARIEGNLIYTSENDADLRPGATVLGRTERREPRPETVRDVGDYVLDLLRSLVGPVVLGLLLLWLVPGPIYSTSDALRSAPLVSLGLGVIALIAVPLVVLFLFILASITGAGFSVPFALGGIYAVLLLLARLIFGLALGSLILRVGKGVEPSVLKGLLALIVGVVLLALILLVPILGGIVSTLVAVMSLGAVIVAFVRWRRARDTLVPAPAAEASTPA